MPRERAERIEWFLASIYCTCKVTNDICTGDFYTLSSCNPNGCGMPNATSTSTSTRSPSMPTNATENTVASIPSC